MFINQLRINSVQKKNLSRTWVFENGYQPKIIDRFEMILQIFAKRAKSNLSKYELALAYLEHSKSQIGGEGGVPIGLLSSIRGFDVLSMEERTQNISGKQSSGKGFLGGEGEKEHNLLMNQAKSVETRLKSLIAKERSKQEHKYEDMNSGKYLRVEPRIALV